MRDSHQVSACTAIWYFVDPRAESHIRITAIIIYINIWMREVIYFEFSALFGMRAKFNEIHVVSLKKVPRYASVSNGSCFDRLESEEFQLLSSDDSQNV